jgi:hypothetical protein
MLFPFLSSAQAPLLSIGGGRSGLGEPEAGRVAAAQAGGSRRSVACASGWRRAGGTRAQEGERQRQAFRRRSAGVGSAKRATDGLARGSGSALALGTGRRRSVGAEAGLDARTARCGAERRPQQASGGWVSGAARASSSGGA